VHPGGAGVVAQALPLHPKAPLHKLPETQPVAALAQLGQRLRVALRQGLGQSDQGPPWRSSSTMNRA
jgi:hypothetical protein